MEHVRLQEERAKTMLQQEKDIRTCLEGMLKEKGERMQTLKSLIEQDQDLCDVLCSEPFSISASSVPSLEQLESFRRHIHEQILEKVHLLFFFLPFNMPRLLICF